MENGDEDHTAVSVTNAVDMGKHSNDGLIGNENKDEMAASSQLCPGSSNVGTDKVNGEIEKPSINSETADDSLSDREDALVIDENPIKHKRKRLASSISLMPFKGYKKRILAQASETLQSENDMTNSPVKSPVPQTPVLKSEQCKTSESDATLETDVETKTQDVEVLKQTTSSVKKETVKCKNLPVFKSKLMGKKVEKLSLNQKREYAQYLGLQPALKFKCSKCLNPNFTTLSALNEHIINCSGKNHVSSSKFNSTVSSLTPEKKSSNNSSTNFKISRKVYLCSSCGTYYENWQLFLHMREFHHRHICLLCLGLFSGAEKLSNHLVTKHNIIPTEYENDIDFLSVLTGPAFIMCCACEKVFTESDDFSGHTCDLTNVRKVAARSLNAQKNASAINKQSNTETTSQKSVTTNPNTSINKSPGVESVKSTTVKIVNAQKTSISKSSIAAKQKKFLPSEHITGDTPVQKVSTETENSPERNVNISDPKETVEDTATSPINNEVIKVTEQECADNKSEDNMSIDVSNKEEEISNKTELSASSQQEQDDDGAVEEQETCAPFKDSNCAVNCDEISAVMTDDSISNKSVVDVEKTKDSDPTESEKDLSDEKDVNDTCSQVSEGNNDIKDDETQSSSLENSVEMQNIVSENKADGADDASCEDVAAPVAREDESAGSWSEALDKPAFEASPVRSNSALSDENVNGLTEDQDSIETVPEVVKDNRRVPKVTLKIPPQTKIVESDSDSDDSCKLTMEIEYSDDKNASYYNTNDSKETDESKEERTDKSAENKSVESEDADGEHYLIAGSDVPVIELGLRQPLERESIEVLLKDFIRATYVFCVYCNHARKIAVNGKQLGLHMMAEHRYSGTVDSITAEELVPESFNGRIKECLSQLQSMFFNLESYDSENPEAMLPYDRTYECFQCRFATTIHKELYLHNRKMHQKTILLCIMCKSTFYSYSELLCHLCPGSYIGSEVKFRCCLCSQDGLPSAFRLMVHLRKRHHACDVCLETCNNQSKLSNHVWKHKLHHLCYRCGIAYRNKPDITKHLFWKHGTQSELCKRCLQKKWPHVYHFCIPPASFICDECNMNFTKAVALKVHKRLHSNVFPYNCTEENCKEKFISKKLLEKHVMKHKEPPPAECINPPTLETEADAPDETPLTEINDVVEDDKQEPVDKSTDDDALISEPVETPKVKPIMDVCDLPALNLSESDSDSDDGEVSKTKPESGDLNPQIVSGQEPENAAFHEAQKPETSALSYPEENKPVPILDDVWDDFKNYQAKKVENLLTTDISDNVVGIVGNIEIVLKDHDYCVVGPVSSENVNAEDEAQANKKNDKSGLDHDYCSVTNDSRNKDVNVTADQSHENRPVVGTESSSKRTKSSKKKTPKRSGSSSSSDSSSDSDSSSCTCGSNCSCSSSSSGSSSSSSSSSNSNSSNSENKRRLAARKEKRLERARNKKKMSENSAVDVTTEEPLPELPRETLDMPIYESDLYTEESETDEDFYDEHPHRLANKIIEEKKNLLMMEVGGPPNLNGSFLEASRTSTPNIPDEQNVEQATPKKKLKVKSKKRKRSQKNRLASSKSESKQMNIPTYYDRQQSTPKPSMPQHNILPPIIATPVATYSPAISIPSDIPSIAPLTSAVILGTTSTGSGSETDSALRFSKRKRVRNKFYGYSSDEETATVDKPPAPPILKWNKADLPSPTDRRTAPPEDWTLKTNPVFEAAITHKPRSSSESSISDADSDDRLHISQPPNYTSIGETFNSAPEPPRPAENVYCYCQCPYDEVSEMIACDGKDCRIEWFHFECVGIMVPPKGKWFCPDCRKKQSMPTP